MTLLGQPFEREDRRRLFAVGAMIETPAFYPYMSGRDNLRVIAATGAPTPVARVDRALEYVGLQGRADSKFSTYSLGMKQRLGIAAALLSDPMLLILDEPANGLDPAGMAAMRETLRWLTDQGKTVLLSSHLLSEVEQLADVVGIIDRGRLVKEGSLTELLAAAGRVRVRVPHADMTNAAPILQRFAPDKQLYGIDSGPQAGTFTVSVEAGRAAEINRALAEAGIYASLVEPGSDLEHLFLQLTMAAPPPQLPAVPTMPVLPTPPLSVPPYPPPGIPDA
jgi:ABC-2 type transport system ATP-binding protein